MLRPPIELMLATAVRDLPEPDSYPGGARYEPKWDGWRAALFVTDKAVFLQSRNGRALDSYFPDVRRIAAAHIPAGTVLDGELVVWQPDHQRTDFAALQQRVVAGRRLPAVAAAQPAQYVVFDVLALGDEDLRPRPLRERRSILEQMLADGPPQLPVCPQTDDIDFTERDAARWPAELGLNVVDMFTTLAGG